MTPIKTTAIAIAAVGIAICFGIAPANANDTVAVPEIEWTETLNKFQFDADKFIGQRFSAKCMPARTKDMKAAVQGTDVYPSDNSICLAALHAGKLTKDGGVVTVQLNPGAPAHTGTKRNGVETAGRPATPRSMIFVDGTNATKADAVQQTHIPRIAWDTKFTSTGFAYKDMIGQRFTFNCPPAPARLKPRRIVGTDHYAFHSIVCQAAVHAGKITVEKGGMVSVQIEPRKAKLMGSIRNGFESKNGSSGVRAITFVDSSVRS
jgi:hypothetical protein